MKDGNPKGYDVIRIATFAYVAVNVAWMLIRKATTGQTTISSQNNRTKSL